MTTMVPRTLVCSSGVDRWLHLGLTGWHLWKASFALDICRVLKQQKTSEIRFTYSLSLWNMRNYHVFKDGLVRSSQWDPAKIIRLSHGAWWRAWLPSSPECVCCLLCAQWQVQRGVGTERRETSERSHPSILFQSNSLGISNFEDFELSSFSIFQHLSAAQVVLSSSFLPPPSHGLGKALWVQHWDPCRDAKRYQGIPPAPVVSDVYRSIGLPSKRNPFCNLRHLRFLGFVHFDETCIMIFWLFLIVFDVLHGNSPLFCLTSRGWKNHKCLTGIFWESTILEPKLLPVRSQGLIGATCPATDRGTLHPDVPKTDITEVKTVKN